MENVAAVGLALVLGLRHALDPDHLVAVTSLVAADDGDVRGASRLGAWWGAGHALTLLLIGVPLIVFKSELPSWLTSGAETAVGIVIVGLAARLGVKWARGDYHATAHRHDGGHARRRHLRAGGSEHRHGQVRSARQAFAMGTLHGLAGTGALVVLLLAGMGSRGEAVAALAVFAPMSVASMVLCTSAFAWVLTRPIIDPVYRTALIPALGAFGLLFGLWYAGAT